MTLQRYNKILELNMDEKKYIRLCQFRDFYVNLQNHYFKTTKKNNLL